MDDGETSRVSGKLNLEFQKVCFRNFMGFFFNLATSN